MWRVCPVLVANACPRVPAEGAGPQRRLAAGHLQLLGEVSAARVAGGGGRLLGAVPRSSVRLSPCRSPAARKRKLVPNGPQAKRTAASSSSESSSEEEDAAPPAKKPGEGERGCVWVATWPCSGYDVVPVARVK